MTKIINYLYRAPNLIYGDWILGSILKSLCEESPFFRASNEWMQNADAYFVQPAWKVTRNIANKSLICLSSYRMDSNLAKIINKSSVLVAHCHAQLKWLLRHGVRTPDAIISDGWQPNITVRQNMPNKFTIGVFGHERVQSYLQTQHGEFLTGQLIKGTDRISSIAKHLDPSTVAWHFGGPCWTECQVYHDLKKMGFEVTSAHYPAHEISPGYHKLDCLLISSRSETGPTVGLDALAAGLPVISTKVGQMIELSDMLWESEEKAVEYILDIQKNRIRFFGQRHIYRSLVANRTRKQFAEKIVKLICERIFGE